MDEAAPSSWSGAHFDEQLLAIAERLRRENGGSTGDTANRRRAMEAGDVSVPVEWSSSEGGEDETTEHGGVDVEPEDGTPRREMPDTPPDENADLRLQFQRLRQTVQQNPDIRTMYNALTAFCPFLLIIWIKLLCDNAVSLSWLVIGYFLFLVAEHRATGAADSENLSLTGHIGRILDSSLVAALFFLLSHLFYDSHLLVLALLLNYGPPPYEGFFSTLYCIIMGDLAAKHITIMAKNLLVEYTSTLYRCIIPYGRWMSYFTGPQGYDEALITDLGLLTIYTFLKVREVWKVFGLWYATFFTLCRIKGYGTTPTQSEIDHNPTCSICYDNMRNPIKLMCSHVFCEDCVDTWLAKESTCPMCRTKVHVEDNTWKSGATSKMVKFY